MSVINGRELSTVYGVVWQTVVANGPPYLTSFNALTVTKYWPSEIKKKIVVVYRILCCFNLFISVSKNIHDNLSNKTSKSLIHKDDKISWSFFL